MNGVLEQQVDALTRLASTIRTGLTQAELAAPPISELLAELDEMGGRDFEYESASHEDSVGHAGGRRFRMLRGEFTRPGLLDWYNLSMKTVILSAFKANCIALLREAQRTAEPIIVTRRGRPLARIEPVREPTPVRRFGKQRGRMRIKGDIVHADFAADWEAGS